MSLITAASAALSAACSVLVVQQAAEKAVSLIHRFTDTSAVGTMRSPRDHTRTQCAGTHWRSEGVRGCGPHRAALARGGKRAKIVFKNSREHSYCIISCVCVQ